MNDYYQVEENIRQGKYNDAQMLLDDMGERDAEWHYLQSVVFYKKNWMNESKKQLEIAMDMEPNNSKYSEEYNKLKAKVDNQNRQFHSGSATENPNRQMGGDMDGCLECCATWCCMNMLCNGCCR